MEDRSGGRRPRAWVQVVIILVVYQAYRMVRASFEAPTDDALANAREIVSLQDMLWLLHEQAIQDWFLDQWEVVIRFWNAYYGVIHFAVPSIALILLWRRAPERYRRWRNIFGWMLLLGLVGFWVYPLMPPRLMPPPSDFVDTAVEIGGFGPLGSASGEGGGGNRYAAMPSLHAGWSLWAALAVWPVLRNRAARIFVALHPGLMVVSVVATGNHWIIDAPAGWLTLGGAVLVEWLRLRARDRLHLHPLLRRPRPG